MERDRYSFFDSSYCEYQRGPRSPLRGNNYSTKDLHYSRRRAVSASGSDMSEPLNRPSATSENYEGPSSNSKVSIHNLIERQSWEKRTGAGVADSFNHEVRGYNVSRDAGSDHHSSRDCHRDYDRRDRSSRDRHEYDRRDRDHYRRHDDSDRYYRRDDRHYHRSRSPPHRSNNYSRGRYDDDDMRRRDEHYSSSCHHDDHRRDHHHSSRYDDRHYDDRHSSYSRDRDHYDGHHRHHRRNDDRRYHESSRDRDRHHHRDSRSRSRHDDSDRRSSSPGWQTVSSRRRRPQTGYTMAETTNTTEVPSMPPYVPPNELNSKFEPFILMLVGIPGAGKTTFAKALENAMPYKYVRINQDQLGNRQECEEKCRSVLREGKCPIIDRCNFNPQQRKYFLDIALEHKVKVDAIVFTYPMEECIKRCESRKDHETIPPGEARSVLERMVRDFSPPLPNRVNAENFRSLRNVTHVGEHNDLILEYLSAALF